MKCKYCGCTDEKACLGGCHWAKNGVCSNCISPLKSLGSLAKTYLNDPQVVLAVITFTDKEGETTSFKITD